MNDYDNGQIIDFVLSQEQRDQIQPILSAYADDASNVMFISSFPKDFTSWLWRIVIIDRHLGQKLLRALRQAVREKSLISRIKRDAPEIALRMTKGEFRSSVRAAAIEAGIVKVKTPLDDLRAAWKKASFEEKHAFRSEISSDEPFHLPF